MQAPEYDIAIVGGGPGGYVAALRAAQLGARVALVEKDRLGGTCLLRGCIPTKALAHSAELLLVVKRARDFGIEAHEPRLNLAQAMARKRTVVETLVGGVEQLIKGAKIDLHTGTGQLLSPRSLRVNGQELKAKNLVLAPGSVPARLRLPGLDLPGVMSSDELLEISQVPPRLAIIGGGGIGMEFASIFAAFGSKVTVIEMLPFILPGTDEEIARRFGQLLRPQGVDVNTGATLREIKQGGTALQVNFDTAQGPKSIEAEAVLVAVGRSPYTEGLGLEGVGIKMKGKAIEVDQHMETSMPGVYAIGDATGGRQLAHLASHQGEVAVENALGHRPSTGSGQRRAVDGRVVPACFFTIPEMAGVGLTEKDAREQSIPHKVSRFPFSALGRAHTLGETAGMVKLVCEEGSGKVLGAHILGLRASDLIAEATLAVKLGLTAKEWAETIHAHPTLPEALREAALGQLDGALHLRKLSVSGP